MLENPSQFTIVTPPTNTSGIQRSIWRSFQLSSKIEEHGLDLFHGLSNELPKGIHKLDMPSLVTIHDLIFIRYPQFYKTLDRAIYFRKTKYACQAASKILAISEQTKTDIIDFIGIEPEKIEVVHQAISPLFFYNSDCRKVKEKYKLPSQFILAVGTIEERKNQLSILQAVVDLELKIPVIFVGNPTAYCNDIHKFIADKGIKKQVIFLKNIPEKDLAAIYQLASMSIYISVFEGFGLPVIESMACGCPVITSNVSCLPETAGGAAILCDPGNIKELARQIKRLLDDETLRNELILKGKKRAVEFMPQKYVERLSALYHKICAK